MGRQKGITKGVDETLQGLLKKKLLLLQLAKLCWTSAPTPLYIPAALDITHYTNIYCVKSQA